MMRLYRRYSAGLLAAAAVALFALPLPAEDLAGGKAGAVSTVAPTVAVMSRTEARARAEALTAVGRQVFFDPTLSASGKMSCASCHEPDRGFAAPNKLPVQFGGADLTLPGYRAVPSLKYLQSLPQFTEHYFESEDEGEESIDNGPTGGLTWDGRVDRGRDQARLPLLSPLEMANDGPAAVVAAVRKSAYADMLRQAFGAAIFADPGKAFDGIVQALEAYEQRYTEFYPYSSKYDAYLAGKAKLTEAEARGLALFNDPAKGNCAHCHISARGADGTPPQFTDYGLAALGAPRNAEIPANADPSFHDLGLCGPLRRDFLDRPEYCGMFKSPSLRNVALRRAFFHNGVFHTLKQVLEFYVERDTSPEKWYPRAGDGAVRKFDDLPSEYHANVNVEPPFDRHPGDKPVLSEAEIDDIIAFLQTLNDGYSGEKPKARR
jgi:cytochrome c peroxidase